jgi:hypothetical protein
MSLHYQTECRIGARRINRSYSGYQAFVAIFFDLFFGLFFELVASILALTFKLVGFSLHLAVQILKGSGKILVAATTALVFMLTLPFAILHRAIAGTAPRGQGWRRDGYAGSVRKPDWAMSREV